MIREVKNEKTSRMYFGNIEDVVEPNSSYIYLQRDNDQDTTWMMYVYDESLGWINIGDTEVDLSNYWSKDDTEELREALNMHDVESISDDNITSAVNEIFD